MEDSHSAAWDIGVAVEVGKTSAVHRDIRPAKTSRSWFGSDPLADCNWIARSWSGTVLRGRCQIYRRRQHLVEKLHYDTSEGRGGLP
jgi:hypothetical protein